MNQMPGGLGFVYFCLTSLRPGKMSVAVEIKAVKKSFLNWVLVRGGNGGMEGM